MANWSDPRIGASQPTTIAGQEVAYDAGLRAHMLKVYNYMASGILLTGIISFLFASSSLALTMVNMETGRPSLLAWAVFFGMFGLVIAIRGGINRMATSTAQILFWIYAGLMGVWISTIFLFYSEGSIALTFFATAAAFTSLSLYGYTTKRDLSAFGTFMLMGVVGLLVALVANMFWQNNTFTLVIAAVGVLVFAGLTAYDTQKIKSDYFAYSGDSLAKAAIIGALELYLDFINMFLFLLRFMGNRN